MCFTISFEEKAVKALKEYLEIHPEKVMQGEFNERYYLVSGFTHPKLPIIKHKAVEVYEWGLIPSFVEDEDKANEIANMTLNARSDTIHDKPSFRNSIKTSRCVLPIDGFYEWQHIGKQKQPYYIYPKEETAFFLGCIYNTWINQKTGEARNTFSIITTDANHTMTEIHNTKKRMPLILPKNSIDIWVDPNTEINKINQMMQPYSTELMTAHTITNDAGNSKLNRNIPEIKKRVSIDNMLF